MFLLITSQSVFGQQHSLGVDHYRPSIKCQTRLANTPLQQRQRWARIIQNATGQIIRDSPAYPFSRPTILNPAFYTPRQICAHARAQGKPFAMILLKTHHCDTRGKVCAASLSGMAHKANTFIQNNFALYQTRFYDSSMGRQRDVPYFGHAARAWNKVDRNPEMIILDTNKCHLPLYHPNPNYRMSILRDKFYSSKRGGQMVLSRNSMEERFAGYYNIMARSPFMRWTLQQKRIPFNPQYEYNRAVYNMRNNRNWFYFRNPDMATNLLIRETAKQHQIRFQRLGLSTNWTPTTRHMDRGLNGVNNY